MKKTSEEQVKALFAEHSLPPLEVIIPILEKAGRGEQELTSYIYETYLSLAKSASKSTKTECLSFCFR
jgi:hypothetical protein